MSTGDIFRALGSAMRLVQLGPVWIPRVVMKVLIKLLVGVQERRKMKEAASTDGGNRGGIRMAGMAPILQYDFAVAEQMVGKMNIFQGIATARKVLLLTGEKSLGYLKPVTDELEKTVNGADRVKIPGTGHEMLCNVDARGSPANIIRALRRFLAQGEKAAMG